MTKVISLASTRAGTRVQLSAPSLTPTTSLSKGELRLPLVGGPTPHQQASIENALVMALHFIRQPGDHAANLWAATARTHRALTLLKHAGGTNAPAGASNVFGGA